MPWSIGSKWATKEKLTPGSSCSSSATWRWPSVLYGLTLSVAETKWVSAVASRPAPDTPALMSTTASAISSRSGSRASSAAVELQPGPATSSASRISSRWASGRP